MGPSQLPTLRNAVRCLIASLCKGRPQSRIQSKFATCWEVIQICKSTSKIRGVPFHKSWGGKNCLFWDGFQLNKTMLAAEK